VRVPERVLELPSDVQERLDELRDLSEKAQDGDKEARATARRELKERLRESSPAVIARASDVSRRAQHMLIGTVAAGDPLTELALSGRLDMLRDEVAGEEPTPLEVLLTEQVVSCWLWLQLLNALMSGQYLIKLPDGVKRSPPSYNRHMLKAEESAHRRFLSSVTALARVRKLQAATPGIQVNTQINLR
jgi:hypothetical protein